MGATPSNITAGYAVNSPYQRTLQASSPEVTSSLASPSDFQKHLGRQANYSAYLSFFTTELSTQDVATVLNKHLFSGTPQADDLLVRLLSGFLHPIIHLGYGLEFSQPAIVAESLAQLATHSNWIGAFFHGAEEAARKIAEPDENKTLLDLAAAARADEKLRASARPSDANKIRDGILQRAPEEMIELAAQWVVTPATLERKVAELTSFTAFMTLGAQRPPLAVKMDFFYMHGINAMPMVGAILKQEWIEVEAKCRLLEWLGREDLALYVSRGCPEILGEEISGYEGRRQNESSWESVIGRVNALDDDGHASKFIRALKFGEGVCSKYGTEKWNKMKHDDWLKGANMVIDSVEGHSMDPKRNPSKWVRGAGFQDEWRDVPDRSQWQV